jgi:aspartyl-tRNA(Asn)/glutamyl-tRNA(Gln) amidotransferase subunit C
MYVIIITLYINAEKSLEDINVELTQKPDIEYLTKLACMELKVQEKASLEKDLESIIGYMNILSSINTDDIEPMEHVLGLSNVTRQDVVAPSFNRELLLSCAPEAEDGFYSVPLAISN